MVKDFRMELRWSAQDPVAQLLTNIPRGQRTKIVQAILNAALLPGGWAKLVQGQLAVALPTSPVAPEPQPDSELPESPPAPVDGMSAAGHQGFMAGLRQFMETE